MNTNSLIEDIEAMPVDRMAWIDNVIVTLAASNAKDVELVGLFGGLLPISKTPSVLVDNQDTYCCVTKGPIIHLLSMFFYEIVQVSIRVKATEKAESSSCIVPFNTSTQKAALTFLEKIHTAMRCAKKVNDFGMITDTTHVELTTVEKRLVETEYKKEPTKNESVVPTYQAHAITACGYGGYGTTVSKPQVTTAVFMRTKPATPEELDTMAAKVKAVMDGSYVAPALPLIPADKITTKEVKEDNKDNTMSMGFVHTYYGD